MLKDYLDFAGLSRFFENLQSKFALKTHNHTKSEITDFPTIPTKTSELTNDSGYIKTVDSSLSSTSTNPVQNKVVNSALSGKVPTTRTVNGKALSANISLTASDVGADASGSAAAVQTNLDAVSDELSDHTSNTNIHFTAEERTKLSGIATGANKYTHPTSSGNKHIPSGGSSGQILRWGSDGTAVWGADNNTTYSVMKGATSSSAGSSGLVPAPASGKQGQYLRGDGVWATPTNTTYSEVTDSAPGLMSSADKIKLDTVSSGAEVNQNAFSNVVVGSITVAADSKTDSLNLASGSNVTISADASTDTITISAKDTTYSAATQSAAGLMSSSDKTKLDGIATGANKYTHPNSGVAAGTYKSVTVNAQGHVTGGTNPTTLSGYGIIDAEAKGTVSSHNTSSSAHNDIRDLITGLTNRLNALADSDDTTLDQMSEVVAYIKNNKTLIDSITTSKVNVSDIINNLTTNVSNKPLSAAQGVAIKALIDALQTAVDGKAASGHTHSAYVNQNAFSNVTVGSTTIAADSATDTLTLVAGNNVTITPDATNDKITIAATNTTYSANTGIKLNGTTFQHTNSVTAATAQGDASKTLSWGGTFTIPTVTYDAQGHITGKGTTTMTMPANPNSDTKVTQTVTTSNATYPILLAPSGQTANATTTSYFDSGVTLNPSTNIITANITGNAGTATKLATARTIALTGSVTGSGSFDGSGNLSIATTTNHTHNYAGSSSAGGSATSAVKLDTSAAGSATQPVYFTGGKPVACTYTLGKSVPSDAVFTDTHYTSHLYVGASGGNANATSATSNPYLLCVDNTTNRNSIQLKAGSNMAISAVNGVVTFTSTNTWRGIQDNLTSTSTSDSLSANQGKVLKGLVDAKAAKSSKTAVTLSASSWSGTSAPYTYAVTISGHANTTDLVELMVGDSMTAAQITALQSANIVRAEWTANTTLTLYAYGTKPTVDAPVNIVVRKDI